MYTTLCTVPCVQYNIYSIYTRAAELIVSIFHSLNPELLTVFPAANYSYL